MRTYEQTHPWIDFKVDARTLDYRTWLLLGEAGSKVEHIAGVPLQPEAAEQLHSVYLAKGVLATTAIEGNTLTEDEVREHLGGQLELPLSRQYLGQEVDNIVEACNLIGREVLSGNQDGIHPKDIREYNRLVLKDLPLQDSVEPGKYRDHSVVIGTYRAAPAEDCEYLVDRFCEWLQGLSFPDGLEQPYAILAAIAAHLYFVWIHPFADGNGRTARLIEFRLLLQAGFPTPAAHLLSNFYNQTRSEYYRQLDNAGKSDGRMLDFIAYAVQGLVDQLRRQLEVIRNLQWDVTWRNYVYEQFGKTSPATARRRRLVLELSKVDQDNGWVRVSDIPQLSPRLAAAYAKKTRKTLSRDVNAIERMNLVQRKKQGQTHFVRANKRLILAFLPARALVEANSSTEDPAG